MVVGLLGLQGAFLDHVRHLKTLDVRYSVVKDIETLKGIDCLIVPGGESSVMGKYLTMFNITNPLRERILSGLPVWGICAGCILLARTVNGLPGILGVLPVDVQRNAYGRQLTSSKRLIDIPAIGRFAFPALFIRAPQIQTVAPQVEVLAELEQDPVCVRVGHLLATTFHPELTSDSSFHEYFFEVVSKGRA